MKRNLKTNVASSSKQENKLRIVMNDVSDKYAPHLPSVALLAETMPLWMPPRLFFKMSDALRGHSKGMAVQMTENLIFFLSGAGRRLTGIEHVDDQLMALYREIFDYARKHNYELGPLF